MAEFGLILLAQASFRFIYPEVPDFPLMGIIGGLALIANATCLWLLIRHRNYDLNCAPPGFAPETTSSPT